MTTIGDWIDSLPDSNRCMWCGRKFDGLPHKREVHHIERRSWAARERRDHPCNLLLVGKSCHDGDLATASHALQLFKKRQHDGTNFDLNQWLRLRDPWLVAPHRVTLSDIEQAGSQTGEF